MGFDTAWVGGGGFQCRQCRSRAMKEMCYSYDHLHVESQAKGGETCMKSKLYDSTHSHHKNIFTAESQKKLVTRNGR